MKPYQESSTLKSWYQEAVILGIVLKSYFLTCQHHLFLRWKLLLKTASYLGKSLPGLQSSQLYLIPRSARISCLEGVVGHAHTWVRPQFHCEVRFGHFSLCVMESQNHRTGKVGRDNWRSSSPTPCSCRVPKNTVTHSCVQMTFEFLHRY